MTSSSITAWEHKHELIIERVGFLLTMTILFICAYVLLVK
jgi:hypothetical protein